MSDFKRMWWRLLLFLTGFGFGQAAIYNNPDLALWSKFALTGCSFTIWAFFSMVSY